MERGTRSMIPALCANAICVLGCTVIWAKLITDHADVINALARSVLP